ncbi:hypothetical protein M427DRAFT_50460 [Gonapodya prolifera JEL478]|uniref:Uncharacterized protein n=1 Tax=Gonapodya prolifera (strain JEL478) TaxID=1344416 RepID=A0A139AZF3_GONPJ|nr:hypothetical protein M427DRAFT_50460 [Gonapodya prolifera JEL478]|eukprot:KXS22097.1 hypothetical protein M427DRAFT_50460 [Gonapodya prolifera JEL478]
MAFSSKPPLRFPSLSKVRTPSSFEAGPASSLRSWKVETLTKISTEQCDLVTEIRTLVGEAEPKVAEILQSHPFRHNDTTTSHDVFEELVKFITAPPSEVAADDWIETLHEVFQVLDGGADLFRNFCTKFLQIADDDLPIFLSYLQPLPEAESIATETASVALDAGDDVDSETRSRVSGGGRSRKVTFEDLDAALEKAKLGGAQGEQQPNETTSLSERSLSVDGVDQRRRSKSPRSDATLQNRVARLGFAARAAGPGPAKQIEIPAEAVSDHVHVALRDREGEIDAIITRNKHFFDTVEKTLDPLKILDFNRTLHTPRRLLSDIDWVHRLKMEAFAESPALFAAFRKIVGYDLDENHELTVVEDTDTFDDKSGLVPDLSKALLRFRSLPPLRRSAVTVLYPALGRALRSLVKGDLRTYEKLVAVISSGDLADERWLMELRRSTERHPGILDFLSEIADYESFWEESEAPKPAEPVEQVVSVPAREDVEFLRACEEEYAAFFNKVSRSLPPKTYGRFIKLLFCSREVLSDEVWLSIAETQYLGKLTPLASEFFNMIGATVSMNTMSRTYASQDSPFTGRLVVDEEKVKGLDGDAKCKDFWSALAKKSRGVERLKEVLSRPDKFADSSWYSSITELFDDVELNFYAPDSLFVRFCTLIGVRSELKSEENTSTLPISSSNPASPLRITITPVPSRSAIRQVESPALLALSPVVDFRRTFSPTLDVFQGGVTTPDDLEVPRSRLPKLLSDALFFHLMRELLGRYWQRFVRQFIDRREEQNFEGKSTEAVIMEVILEVGEDDGHELAQKFLSRLR